MDEGYKKLVDVAYNLHVSGKLDDAKFAYEKLLNANPDDLEVKNLYAQLNVALKNYDIALDLFKDIYEKTSNDDTLINIAKVYYFKGDFQSIVQLLSDKQNLDSAACRILATAYTKLNDVNSTIDTYLKIVNLNQATATDYMNLSIMYSKNNDYENSLKYALSAYQLNKSDLNVNLHLAFLYENMSDWANALKHLQNSAKVSANIDIYYRIALMYKKLEDDDSAIAYLNAILDIEPDNQKVLLLMASIFSKHDKKVSAEIYNKLIEKNPDDEDLLLRLAITYSHMAMYEEVIDICKKIININENSEWAYTFIGDALTSLFRYEEALEFYKKALNYTTDKKYIEIQISYIYSNIGKIEEAKHLLAPYLDDSSIHTDWAYLFARVKNMDEARDFLHEHLNRVISDDEINYRANFNMYHLNIDKKYSVTEDIWQHFKKTTKHFKDKASIYFEKDFYKKDIKGKRILLYSRHGNGDTIMFSRYIKKVIDLASEVTIQIPESFVSLFKYNFPQCKIVNTDELIDASKYDLSSDIFSLLCNFNNQLTDIPNSSGYLRVSDDKVKEMSKLDVLNTSKKKVGLFWQGNPTLLYNRSIKLEKLKPLFDRDDIQFYSFQLSKIDSESEELKNKLPIIDLAPYIKSYEDTAALLKNIDILLSIDTSISNLGGAIGTKTYLLLPKYTEWRWFFDTETTPWYDSVRIFKQTNSNCWDDVVLRVKNEL